MRVGLDTFTLHPLALSPLQVFEYVQKHDLEGAQFGELRGLSSSLDIGEIREIRAQADRMGLYTCVSLPACNPHIVQGSLEAHAAEIRRQIELAAQCGWHELHSCLGGGDERYTDPEPWTKHLADSAQFIRGLAPILCQTGSRINLETHGDSTTFELVRLIEDVGPDVAGICLDTANVLCHAEDPVLAARRAAPYTHLTHTKDAIIFFTDTGYRRQTVPAGTGALEWDKILPALAEYSPDLPISIEDHKWFFDFHIFDQHWLRLHPDLTRDELARVVRIAWKCQQRIASGRLPDPETYEKVPFADQLEERVCAGRDYLKRLLDRLGLSRNRTDVASHVARLHESGLEGVVHDG